MRVNQVAKTLGVTPDTVRFYTRIDILHPRKSAENGYHEYTTQDVSRLRFVMSARHLGFSVEDIKEILAQSDHRKSACPTVRRLLNARLVETEQRFQEMVRLRQRMRAAIEQWDTMQDREPTGDMVCHLIDSFLETETPSALHEGTI